MKLGGYVYIHRKMLNNDVLRDSTPYSRCMAWMWMILNANFEPYTIYNSGIKWSIPEGSIVMSKRKLAKLFRWSNSKMETFLRDLKNSDMITIQKLYNKQHITLNNYLDLQNKGVTPSNPLATQKRNVYNGSKRNNKIINKTTMSNFDEFWTSYGKKVGSKVKCLKYWDGELKVMDGYKIKESDRGKILKHIPEYKKTVSDLQYLPHPSTYLYQRIWESELDIVKKKVEFRRDVTDTSWIGYCSKCSKSDFYENYNFDSHCCGSRLLPRKNASKI